MPLRPEDLRQIFDESQVVTLVEQHVGHVQALITTGSVLQEGWFDCQGPNTSDIDFIAVIGHDFPTTTIPAWETLLSNKGVLQSQGEIQGRRVHLRAYSENRVRGLLDVLLEQLDTGSMSNVSLPIFAFGQEMVEGVIVHGSLLNHNFFSLYYSSPTNSIVDVLRNTGIVIQT